MLRTRPRGHKLAAVDLTSVDAAKYLLKQRSGEGGEAGPANIDEITGWRRRTSPLLMWLREGEGEQRVVAVNEATGRPQSCPRDLAGRPQGMLLWTWPRGRL